MAKVIQSKTNGLLIPYIDETAHLLEQQGGELNEIYSTATQKKSKAANAAKALKSKDKKLAEAKRENDELKAALAKANGEDVPGAPVDPSKNETTVEQL